jgi:raffinose/stachyose/melibiose transport system substrate-binding protein
MRTNRRKLIAGSSALAASAALTKGLGKASAQDSVKIRWWHIVTDETNKGILQGVADQFAADNPGVTVEITVLENEAFKTKLATAMQGGDPPDVFQSWGGGVLYQYAEAGLIREITADLAADGWGATFNEAALGLYANNSQNWGVPWNVGMVGFWYNKALFSKAGVEAVPTTWADLLTTVSKIKDAGIVPIAVGEKDKWPGHFYWVYQAIRNGGKAAFDAAYTRTGKFSDPPFVQAGADLKQLIDLEPFQEGFLGATFPDESAAMGNGKAAMELMGQWAPSAQVTAATNKTGLGDDLGFFIFPSVDGGAGDPNDALGGCDGYAIGKNAPDQAVAFVRYLTSLDVQTMLASKGIAVLPVVKGADEAITDPNLVGVKESLAKAKYLQLYYDQFLPPAVGATVNDSVQGLFAGTSSPEDVANAIEASAAQELVS